MGPVYELITDDERSNDGDCYVYDYVLVQLELKPQSEYPLSLESVSALGEISFKVVAIPSDVVEFECLISLSQPILRHQTRNHRHYQMKTSLRTPHIPRIQSWRNGLNLPLSCTASE